MLGLTGTTRKVFLSLTALLALTDAAFVSLNYHFARDALHDSLEVETRNLAETVRVAVSMSESEMLQLATFVANDPRVTAMFLAGKNAVAAEGGGAGGAEAAARRAALYDLVEPAWAKLTSDFDVRQLHFHLEDNATSFLRVHSPAKFGDSLEDVRHTITDTHRERVPRAGFESGRVYAGLRGVAPVWAADRLTGQISYVGALEAGASFQSVFRVLEGKLGGHVAVALSDDHVRATMWPDEIAARFGNEPLACDCRIEATTSPQARDLLNSGALERGVDREGFGIVTLGDAIHAVGFFPVRDYLGVRDPTRPAIGRMLVWTDATTAWTDFRRSFQWNIVIAVLGFLVIESLLFVAIRFITRRLRLEVEGRTAQVRALLDEMEVLAKHDGLTGLPNRRSLEERTQEEISRAGRSGRPLSVIMFDIDHFKLVNDRHGHVAGDRALQAVANITRQLMRGGDFYARYGGEEFCAILPDTAIDGALQMGERLREALESLALCDLEGKSFHIAASFGITQWQAGQGMEEVFSKADEALYRAKSEGRNRVCYDAAAALSA